MTHNCPLGRDVCDSCTALSDLTVARCLSLVRFEFFFSVKVRKMATKGHMCLPAQRSTAIWPAALRPDKLLTEFCPSCHLSKPVVLAFEVGGNWKTILVEHKKPLQWKDQAVKLLIRLAAVSAQFCPVTIGTLFNCSWPLCIHRAIRSTTFIEYCNLIGQHILHNSGIHHKM